MPTPVMAADLLLNPKGLARAIEDEVSAGASAGLEGGTKASQNKVMKAMYEARWNAIKLGNQKEADSIKVLAKQKEATIIGYAAKLKKVNQEIKASEDAGIEDSARKELVAKQRNLSKMITLEQRAIEDASDKMAKGQANRLALLDAGLKKSARSLNEKMEDGLSGFADNFEGAISQALSAENLDLGALVKGMGSALKDAGPSLVSGGTSLAKKGGAMAKSKGMVGMLGKAAGMLGGAAASLGAVVGVLAGVAAVIGAVVAVMMAAYGQTKEFNKAILEGAGALDMLSGAAVGSANALGQELGKLRKSAMLTAMEFRTTTEEVLAVTSAMNQAGFTFKEQTKVFGTYREAMSQGIIVMQNFGVGAGEYAEMVNTMTRDFAMGQQQIAESFGDIFGAATMSGMGVKNFFTAIGEATSGMALYNFRLEDTLELMVGLEKILGEDMGKQVMGQLKGKYKGMGTQEKYNALMTSGAAGRGVLNASSARQEKAFTQNTSDIDMAALHAAALKLGLDIGGSGEAKLGKLSRDDVASLQVAVEGAAPEMADKLSGLFRTQRGSQVGASMGARSEAMGELDQMGTLAFDMTRSAAVLGEKGISDLEGISKMAFENITGQSGEMLTAYQDIYARVKATMKDQDPDQDLSLSAVTAAIASGDMLSKEDEAKLAEAAKTGSEKMTDIAKQQLKETTSILQTLKTGVVMMLELIYDTMNIFGGEDIAGARQKMEAEEKKLAGMEIGDAGYGAQSQAAKRTREAYEAVLQGGTSEGSYQEGAGIVSGEDQLRSGMAVKGGDGLLMSLNRLATASGHSGVTSAADYMGLPTQVTPEQSLPKNLGATGVQLLSTLMQGLLPGTGMLGQGFNVTGEAYATGSDIYEDADVDKRLVEMDGKQQAKADEQINLSEKAVALQAKLKSELSAVEKNTDPKRIADLKRREELAGMGVAIGGNATVDEITAAMSRYNKEDAQYQKLDAHRNIIGADLEDFIYRGNAQSGTIHPIDSMDSFFGAKPGGAIDKAMGGRGVVINNLTINESGNPQKTLSMIKQAITAANK